MRRQDILDEFNAHLQDLIDEYVADGLPVDAARERAMRVFGDMNTHIEATLRTRPSSQYTQAIVYGTIYTSIAAVSLAAFIASGSYLGAILAPVVIYALDIGILLFTLLCAHTFISLYGVLQPRVLWYVGAYTLCVHTAITITLDIDKFEAIVHSLTVLIIGYIITTLFWQRFSFTWRKILILTFPAIIITAALFEHRLLDIFGTMKCLFITPDTVPLTGALQTCSQVRLWSHVLWPIYIALGMSIFFMIRHVIYLIRLHNHSSIALMSISALLCIATPITFYDLNNTGQLDIAPWEAEVFRAYQDVLGRNPQQKDIDFYALTRSYEHMEKIREVLYASEERQLKIRLLYREILQREPTEQEIQFYVHARTSIDTIRTQLSQHQSTYSP